MTAQEELDLVDGAITQLLGGRVAEWGEGQHRVKTLDLATLYRRRDELRNQVAQETRSIFMPVREVQRESPY